MKDKYQAILYNNRPKSKHLPLSKEQRAAQFSPFAALKGYEESIIEEARIVEDKIILSDDEKMILNNKLNYIINHHEEIDKIKITYFIPDARKYGGKYQTIFSQIKRIDKPNQFLILTNKMKIKLDDILDLNFDFSKNDKN